MSRHHPNYAPDDPLAVERYRTAMQSLRAAKVEFLVGGAYAFARYTDITRHTKDFDIFIRPADCDRAVAALAAAGFQTEITYAHWLAKAKWDDYFIDLIYSSGNGAVPVDDGWFQDAMLGEVLGEQVHLVPPEELIWSKAFIMERNRYDGSDIIHVLRAVGDRLDWHRLLGRFGRNWRVLFSHLILFGFVYPHERDRVPRWVIKELTARLDVELSTEPPAGQVCRGTLLAALPYIADVESWEYADARLPPHGSMTEEQVAEWTHGVLTGR